MTKPAIVASVAFVLIIILLGKVCEQGDALRKAQQKITKHTTETEELVTLEQKRREQISSKWKERFNNREKQVIKEDIALLELHEELVKVSAAFLKLRMGLSMRSDLKEEAFILANEALNNRAATLEELVEQKWLKNISGNPVSALDAIENAKHIRD